MSTEFRRYREFTYGGLTGFKRAVAGDGSLLASHGPTPPIYSRGDQITHSTDTLFPLTRRLQRHAHARGRKSRWDEGRHDLGAPFQSIRRSYDDDGAIHRVVNLPITRYLGGITYGYSGPLLGLNPSSWSNYPAVSTAALHTEMQQWGASAIANTIPTNPAVDVGNLIGESMQRLPSLPGAALFGRPGNISKKFADEYLNYEFGLKPLISDAGGIVQTIKDTNRILEQLERDSGRLIRRRYGPVEDKSNHTVSETSGKFSYPSLATAQYAGNGTRIHRRFISKRMWFSGAYTYHYAQGSDLWSRMKRNEQAASRLSGLRLTPGLVWELSPWSWAADWKTNAGDVLRNISAFSHDGLVLRWGYVMCDYKVTDIHYTSINLTGYGVIRLEQRFTTHVKKRIRATPYGFGLDPDWKDFSSRQLAILGALGITRGR